MNDLIKLVPNLRFPAFIQDGEWKEQKFGSLFAFLPNNTLSRADLKEGKGDVYNVHYGDVLIKLDAYTDIQRDKLPAIKTVDDIEKYRKACLQDGDIVIADTAEDETVGKCTEIVNVHNTLVVSGLHTIPCRPQTKFAQAYLGYYMNSNAFHNKLLPIMQGVKVTSISKSALQNIDLEFPESLEEQQKIAECLSSIDSYISSINEKVEQLKAHKKSLMQKLFPQKGQTIPEYRFPEFDNNGKWEKHILSDITSVVNDRCGVNNLCIETYISTENMLPNYGGVKIASKLPVAGSFTYFMKGDVLFSNIRPYLKKVWCANFDGVTSNDIIVFRAKTGFDACFVSCILMSDAFIDYSMIGAKGVKMPRGDKDMMLNYNVYVPYLEEQQKIAECLSSIDEAIRLYSEKAFLMEQHKKGLMQQLFPTSK